MPVVAVFNVKKKLDRRGARVTYHDPLIPSFEADVIRLYYVPLDYETVAVSNVVVLLTLHFFFQAEDGIRDGHVTGVQTCALPISPLRAGRPGRRRPPRRRAGV